MKRKSRVSMCSILSLEPRQAVTWPLQWRPGRDSRRVRVPSVPVTGIEDGTPNSELFLRLLNEIQAAGLTDHWPDTMLRMWVATIDSYSNGPLTSPYTTVTRDQIRAYHLHYCRTVLIATSLQHTAFSVVSDVRSGTENETPIIGVSSRRVSTTGTAPVLSPVMAAGAPSSWRSVVPASSSWGSAIPTPVQGENIPAKRRGAPSTPRRCPCLNCYNNRSRVGHSRRTCICDTCENCLKKKGRGVSKRSGSDQRQSQSGYEFVYLLLALILTETRNHSFSTG